MPRYHFVVRWPDKEQDDQSGTVLVDERAARDLANRIIRELRAGQGYDHPKLMMIVKNTKGDMVLAVPFRKRKGGR
jgi:hypothetical protein